MRVNQQERARVDVDPSAVSYDYSCTKTFGDSGRFRARVPHHVMMPLLVEHRPIPTKPRYVRTHSLFKRV